MSNHDSDKIFSGSIPKLYETYLVPLIFETYAADLANRLRSRPLSRVLEIAAGTGVVTRALASALPESVSIVATDLNQAMLDQASLAGTKRAVEWRQADTAAPHYIRWVTSGATKDAQTRHSFSPAEPWIEQ